MTRKIFGVLFSGIITLLVFIILIISLNIMASYVRNSIFHEFVFFFNNNIILLVWIALIMTVAEILFILKFPFNIPAPCFNAVGAFLIVSFLANLFMFLKDMGSLNWQLPFNDIFFIISSVVFFIVLLIGYYNIFKNMPKFKQATSAEEESEEEYEEREDETGEGEPDEEKEEERLVVKRVKPKTIKKQRQIKKKTSKKQGKRKK